MTGYTAELIRFTACIRIKCVPLGTNESGTTEVMPFVSIIGDEGLFLFEFQRNMKISKSEGAKNYDELHKVPSIPNNEYAQ